MPNSCRDRAMFVVAGKHAGVTGRIGMWSAICVPFEGDRRHRNSRAFGETALKPVILRLTVGQPEAPAVIVDDDVDVIGIVEGFSAALEGRVVEPPLRGGQLPDKPRECFRVRLIPCTPALGG